MNVLLDVAVTTGECAAVLADCFDTRFAGGGAAVRKPSGCTLQYYVLMVRAFLLLPFAGGGFFACACATCAQAVVYHTRLCLCSCYRPCPVLLMAYHS